jgi:hypothetical protein
MKNGNGEGSAHVLVPLQNGAFIALTKDAFVEARALGAELAGAAVAPASGDPTQTEEPLLTAEQIGERMNTPATWFLEQARKDAIPHVKLGKYVRFRFSEVREAFAQGGEKR